MQKKEHKAMSSKDTLNPMLHGHLDKSSQNWLSGKMSNPIVKNKSKLSKTLKKLK